MGILDHLFGPPSQDKFAQLVVDGIRQAGETSKIVYDRGQFRLSAVIGRVSVKANIRWATC